MKRRSHSYTCLLFMLCGVLAGACTAPDADTPDTPEAYNEPEIPLRDRKKYPGHTIDLGAIGMTAILSFTFQ